METPGNGDNTHGTRNVQPDINILKERKLTWIEVTVSYEKDEDTIKKMTNEKLEKYRWIKPEHLTTTGIDSIEVIPIVIGSCGTVNKTTVKYLKKLKIAAKAKKLQITTMMGSVDVLNTHMRS